MSEERKEEVVTVARVNASQPTFTWPTPPRADRDGSAGDRERWPQYSQLTPSCKVKAQNCLSLAMMWFRKKQQVREHVMCENTVLLGHCDNWKQCILWRIDCCDNFDRFKYCIASTTVNSSDYVTISCRDTFLSLLRSTLQGWAKEWSLGCVNSRPAARGSQEAGFTQPRDHSFAQPCIMSRNFPDIARERPRSECDRPRRRQRQVRASRVPAGVQRDVHPDDHPDTTRQERQLLLPRILKRHGVVHCSLEI